MCVGAFSLGVSPSNRNLRYIVSASRYMAVQTACAVLFVWTIRRMCRSRTAYHSCPWRNIVLEDGIQNHVKEVRHTTRKRSQRGIHAPLRGRLSNFDLASLSKQHGLDAGLSLKIQFVWLIQKSLHPQTTEQHIPDIDWNAESVQLAG